MLFCRTIAVTWPLFLFFGCRDNSPVVMPTLNSGQGEALDRTFANEVLPAVEQIARSYVDLTLVTKEPVLVDPQLASLCVSIRPQFVEDAIKRNGPHAHTSVRIFMNGVAADALRDEAAKYPVGSVIVKEKQGLNYDLVNDDGELKRSAAKTANGVGGMVKRPVGYDPEHGDWEYFYFEDSAKIEHGKIASCVECHRGASATDYVFGCWAANQ